MLYSCTHMATVGFKGLITGNTFITVKHVSSDTNDKKSPHQKALIHCRLHHSFHGDFCTAGFLRNRLFYIGISHDGFLPCNMWLVLLTNLMLIRTVEISIKFLIQQQVLNLDKILIICAKAKSLCQRPTNSKTSVTLPLPFVQSCTKHRRQLNKNKMKHLVLVLRN